MYYIQNLKKIDPSKTYRQHSLAQWLEDVYMGAAEFEWGTLSVAWRFLSIASDVQEFVHTVQSKGGLAKEVTFHVITTPAGFEYFKKKIDFHLDGTTVGERAKRWTGLWEKFNANRPEAFGSNPDAWIAVGGVINAALNNYSDTALKDLENDRYRDPQAEGAPIFFTADATLAKRVFLKLRAHVLDFNPDDFHIGDQVLTYLHHGPMKVCGLNEDDTISCKVPHGKAVKFFKDEVYPYEQAITLFKNV